MKLNCRFKKKASFDAGNMLMTGGRLAAICVAIFFTSVEVMSAAGTNAPASSAQIKTVQTADAPAAKPRKQVKAKAKKQLSGAELYAANCNRCHPERDPSEFTASQWKTMMIYMRVRANIPASQARAIEKYLQDQAGQ